VSVSWQVVSVPAVHSVEIGLARQQALADELTSQSSKATLMIWRSQPALLVSRSEARLPHFKSAAAALHAAGWPVVVRKSGGGCCPVGPGTIQLSTIEPAAGATMNAQYAILAELIRETLGSYQITAQTGAIADAYCPGRYDRGVEGRKIAGMSQHWFRNAGGIRCVITAASINVQEQPDALAAAINQFYAVGGSSLRCQAGALTNMRLCGAALHFSGQDLTAAVMARLAANMQMLGEIGQGNPSGKR
jgi:octanoyl-[GcvH]:protein N-octanoyltransferase